MEINKGLKDYDHYLSCMRKSLYDKMFFVDKLFDDGVDTIVDFGCADGSLIQELQHMLPSFRFIGYDISEEMLRLARQKVPDALFISDWEALDIVPERTALNLSSVLHEVYAYGTEEDVHTFWQRVFHTGFRYICIRDMMLSSDYDYRADGNNQAALAALLDTIRRHPQFADVLAQFEARWGKTVDFAQLVHFYLKYQYAEAENWGRELNENYLAVPSGAITERAAAAHYRCTYGDSYILPYLQHRIHKDFGVTFTVPTHGKLIFRKESGEE